MDTIFVGGPGRSGTSFVARCLAEHPEICAFREIELKLFTEASGLLDLYLSIVRHFSPNRSVVALQRFASLMGDIFDGRYGQAGLVPRVAREDWDSISQQFSDALCSDGQPVQSSPEKFFSCARELLKGIADLAASTEGPDRSARMFLEKTPQALLEIDFLHCIDPMNRYIHVMRDPRSIAWSLQRVAWGPSTLEGCCQWVTGYCQTWEAAQTRAARQGIEIIRFDIESVAASPVPASEYVCRTLGLSVTGRLFDHANVDVLNGWTRDCDSVVMETLEDRLGPLACRFGYESGKIGSLKPELVPTASESMLTSACAAGRVSEGA